jgi:hypothetical protein
VLVIVPLQCWGGGFNFSIWHVQLWGTTEEERVGDAVAGLAQVRRKAFIRWRFLY